jgi:hypothetical protein
MIFKRNVTGADYSLKGIGKVTGGGNEPVKKVIHRR